MSGISGFQDYRRSRPSITPEEMGAALIAQQQRLDDSAAGPDDDELFTDAVTQAARRAQPQQSNAGMSGRQGY